MSGCSLVSAGAALVPADRDAAFRWLDVGAALEWSVDEVTSSVVLVERGWKSVADVRVLDVTCMSSWGS